MSGKCACFLFDIEDSGLCCYTMIELCEHCEGVLVFGLGN